MRGSLRPWWEIFWQWRWRSHRPASSTAATPVRLAGWQGRRFRIEARNYGERTGLSDRGLLGEMEQAISRDRAIEAWILVATRDVPEQLQHSLMHKGEKDGVPVIIIEWDGIGLAGLAALCASAPSLVTALVSEEAGRCSAVLAEVAQARITALHRELEVWMLSCIEI